MSANPSPQLSGLTQQAYAEEGRLLSLEANVLDSLHAYFVQQGPRLYQACRLFQLFERDLGDVLEIGPFYGYTPFVLQRNASSYTILEGDDPAAYSLKPLYQKREIAAHFTDLFELFGPTHAATRSLRFPPDSFDTILCWETMEHFNFNPVPFVRELYRMLKPGGRVYITVPNKASFQNIVALVFGRFEKRAIDAYYHFEEYSSNEKKAFYGFHWREYSRVELAHLFEKAGFTICKCNTFVAFQVHPDISVARRVARQASRLLGAIFRRYGTNVYLVAQK